MPKMDKQIIGNAELYCGDCRNVLSGITADAVITDPVWPNCPDGLLEGADRPQNLLAEVVERLPDNLKRLVIVMRSDSDSRMLSVIPMNWPFFRIQILPYVMPGYIGRKLGGDEIAYSFGEPIPSLPGQRLIPGHGPKVQPTGRPANGHPCSRSLEHFLWLVRWWSMPAETVLDPFMGGGTTGVAAVQLGRKFIGIEIEPRFFDLACQRIEDAQRQGTFPVEEQEGCT